MSGKSMKLLRRFNRVMRHDRAQYQAGKSIYKGLNVDGKHQLKKEMREFVHEHAQSVEGLQE